ncbi:hypothetical protein [Streptomyces sp. NBC_01276]|uniref:hypothetical protein n=1 Tax=Streptomyces sp. NBC_01276 TaxID=2903808 RepID=UPI00352D0F08
MDDAILSAMPGAGLAVILLFLGAWETDRRNKRKEARKEVAENRATLEAQVNEFVASVLAVKVAGNMHEHLYAGWRARGTLLTRWLGGASAAYLGSPRHGLPAAMMAVHAMNAVVDQWDEASTVSAAKLAAPLGRLGAAAAPLMRRQEAGVAAAVDRVFTAITENYADEDRINQALAALYDVLRPALDPPTPPRRRWTLRRRSGELRLQG